MTIQLDTGIVTRRDVSNFPNLSVAGTPGVLDALPYRLNTLDEADFSYVESGSAGTKVVVRLGGMLNTTVNFNSGAPVLETPEALSTDRYGGSLVYGLGPNGATIIMAALGDRALPDKAQDLGSLFGKIVRVNDRGAPRIPTDNPFIAVSGAAPEIWAYGFRDPVVFGDFAFDIGAAPGGGDELNYVRRGCNYGWPSSPTGSTAPVFTWPTPIRPLTMITYNNDILIGSAVYAGLIRMGWDGARLTELQRIPLPAPIRKLHIYGSKLYGMEDGVSGRLIQITLN